MSDVPEYQARVIAEKAELDERISKLGAFLDGEVFKTLDIEDRALMMAQLTAMHAYSYTLGGRIERFNKTT